MMYDNYCSDCKSNTEVIYDHTAGDTICSECGLVLESRSIDETSEWRTFAADSNDNDPNRVGKPVNLILNSSSPLSTVIAAPKGSKNDFTLSRFHNLGGDPDRTLIAAFKEISNVAERLDLVTTIKDRASEMYKKLEDLKCTRGRNLEALVAGCIFIACRQEGKSRTVKEICSAISGVTKKELGRANKFIVSQLKDDICGDVRTIDPDDYLRRFCSTLGMSNEEVKDVKEAMQKAKDFDIRRSPTSIAAAVIFMISQLSVSKKLLRDIATVTTVAESTIKNAFKDLYPYAAKIIPERYAKERDLNILSKLNTYAI